MRSRMIILWMVGILFIILSACADNSQQDQENNNTDLDPDHSEKVEEPDPDPVTISMQVHWTEEMFNERWKEPLEDEYPWLTVEHVQVGSNRDALEEMFADGISPDIFFELSQADMEYFELDYDLDEMIEKEQYNLDHINPVFLESIRAKDKERRLLGLPYEVKYFVLFYNKDIFDIFGQDYPTNEMTWEEVLELGRNLTGERNGVQYQGLDLGTIDFESRGAPLMQLSVNKTDPETGEVLLNQPEFTQYLEVVDQIIDIHALAGTEPFNSGRYVEDQTTAMLVEFVQALNWWEEEELNDAVAPLPVWDVDDPVSHRPDSGIIPLSINPHSENKEAAFKAITYFTEKEYQVWASRNGLGPVSNETEVLDQFFQDYESTHDKNVPAIFEHQPATPPEQISVWDQYVDFDIIRYAEENIDRNEFIRIITEESETKIKEAKLQEE